MGKDAPICRPRGEKRPLPDDDGADGPACHSCRKRKARCSKQQPCSQCVKLNIDCLYDETRQRPGMRTGAIESLNRRLTSLEQMFLGQGLLLRPLLGQLQKQPSAEEPVNLSKQTDDLRQELISVARGESLGDENVEQNRAHPTLKNHNLTDATSPGPPGYSLTSSALPSVEVVDNLVELYFQQIHPWIPVLHISSFKDSLRDPTKRESLSTILHAIVSVCLPLEDCDFARSHPDVKGYCLRCRHTVMLRSFEAFSVQNLQALIIVAFDIIGSGRGPSAWSVIGSMARTVEQLQLTVEDDAGERAESSKQSLLDRMAFLRAPATWIEAEERRRVFWTIFLMDRFCSVATGWNNSLTGADVRRRLPCEGMLWEIGTAIRTPYFGIAERSSAPPTADPNLLPNSERHHVADEEVDNIGGFAFCIEATESLNLVTTFFLRHTLNFESPQDVQVWIMRFKELDLRLVKWKLFLPSRWADAAAPNSQGLMDPNLALAHITHNTAVIQLHQFIAYPSARWKSCAINLPSATSSETCLTAASEIRTIAEQYLLMSHGVVNPQFSFCLFVAGRVLLAHAAHNPAPLSDIFADIVSCLQQIAARWNKGTTASSDNLALRFMRRLQQAQSTINGEHAPKSFLDIRQPVYSDDLRMSHPGTRRGSTQWSAVPQQARKNPGGPSTPSTGFSPDSMSLAFPPMPLSFQQCQDGLLVDRASDSTQSFLTAAVDADYIMHSAASDPFNDFSNIFDTPFLEMSRVSTYANCSSE